MDLGLADEPQDWGIVNADPTRLAEFIAFAESGDLAPTQFYDLVGLVLASANEALLSNSGENLERVRALLAQHMRPARAQIVYWGSLTDNEEFPIGDWIRRHFPAC